MKMTVVRSLKVGVARDELRALIDADAFEITSVDDREHADLAAGGRVVHA